MPQLKIDKDLIRSLAELLDETGLTDIEIADGDKQIRVSKTVNAYVASPAGENNESNNSVTSSISDEISEHSSEQKGNASQKATRQHGAITSPLVGTAYRSPEPGEAPFITEGDTVTEGQTLLIVEAMKTMNPIKAPHGGQVSQILVENGAPVEFGELLVIID